MTDGTSDTGCVYCKGPIGEGQHGAALDEYATLPLPCCNGLPSHVCFPMEGVTVLMCGTCQKKTTYTKPKA